MRKSLKNRPTIEVLAIADQACTLWNMSTTCLGRFNKQIAQFINARFLLETGYFFPFQVTL